MLFRSNAAFGRIDTNRGLPLHDGADNTGKLLAQCGTDALSNVLIEFWPDVKHKLSKKKN